MNGNIYTQKRDDEEEEEEEEHRIDKEGGLSFM